MRVKGYDTGYFIDPLDSRYVCGLCHGILRKPVKIACPEEHCVCEGCAMQHFSQAEEGISCPICDTELEGDLYAENADLALRLGQLRVRCLKPGCVWVGQLGNLETHERGDCPARSLFPEGGPVSKPGVFLSGPIEGTPCSAPEEQKPRLAAVFDSIPCSEAPVATSATATATATAAAPAPSVVVTQAPPTICCPACSAPLTASADLEAHKSICPMGDAHKSICPMGDVSCPHCDLHTTRAELRGHVALCQSALVSCPVPQCGQRDARMSVLSVPGARLLVSRAAACAAKGMMRSELAGHLTANAGTHIVALAERLRATEIRLDEEVTAIKRCLGLLPGWARDRTLPMPSDPAHQAATLSLVARAPVNVLTAGMFLDLRARVPLRITGFAFGAAAVAVSQQAMVFMRRSSHRPYTGSPDGWTQLLAQRSDVYASVPGLEANKELLNPLSLPRPVEVRPGEIVGFYIYSGESGAMCDCTEDAPTEPGEMEHLELVGAGTPSPALWTVYENPGYWTGQIFYQLMETPTTS
ncbi:hypothetical protein PAPYR_8120 [Paratrimastix pyriformis]|uniref:TRAF-type domain-containing protein n=1 Tax=Paratrimastix pyriformis TaxID=342808 RepID=A0ABQ8UE37_9EUKA|nr:hypothetical protein PAPYR_8120 [Paratrimastix pyriformis]